MLSNPELMLRTIITAEKELSACLTSPRQARVALTGLTRRERQVVLDWFRHCRYKTLRVAGSETWYLYRGQKSQETTK